MRGTSALGGGVGRVNAKRHFAAIPSIAGEVALLDLPAAWDGCPDYSSSNSAGMSSRTLRSDW